MFCCQVDGQGRPVIESSGALVVGNPQLMPTIAHHWHLKEIPGAEYEARILGELLSCRPLIGPEATKGAVLHQIEQVGSVWLCCCHPILSFFEIEMITVLVCFGCVFSMHDVVGVSIGDVSGTILRM